jgi:CheY-like chemotaxis protein
MNPNADVVPKILVLDDEEVQRLTIHRELSGLGDCIDFSDPRPAVEYLRAQTVDAVVVDIRMPFLPVDGLWFLARLREFDRLLGVVLRTADDDIAIAQAGIEARALQRVIKGKPESRLLLRDAVSKAIEETRVRRREISDAADTVRTRSDLVNTLGRLDEEISTAEMCRGFVMGLVDQITTLTGFAELLADHPKLTANPELAQLANKNRAATAHLSDLFSDFVSNPYIGALSSPPIPSRTNPCCDALRQIFRHHLLFSANRAVFTVKSLPEDMPLSSSASRTLTALRHLVEYCAARVAPGATVALATTELVDASAALRDAEPPLVLNRRWAPARPTVEFSVTATLGESSIAQINEDLRRSSTNPRCGNLMMLTAACVEDHLALSVTISSRGATTFSLFIPVGWH